MRGGVEGWRGGVGVSPPYRLDVDVGQLEPVRLEEELVRLLSKDGMLDDRRRVLVEMIEGDL